MNLKELAKQKSVELIERPNGHFQIKGNYLVNYYPNSKKKTAYVAGTLYTEYNVSPKRAIDLSLNFQGFVVDKVKRKNYNKTKEKLKLIQRQNGLCYICKKIIEDYKEANIDHVIPLSKGGLDNANNRAVTHKNCNFEKADRLMGGLFFNKHQGKDYLGRL